MIIGLTASVLTALEAINAAIHSAIKTLFGGKGVVSRLGGITITSLKENDGSRKIREKGVVIAFDPINNIYQEVRFSVVCRVVKTGSTWTSNEPVFEDLTPGAIVIEE